MESINFRLATGEQSYALYIDGEPVDAFNCYMNDLARTDPANTVKSKASDLRIFFAYLNALDEPNDIAELKVGVSTGTPLLTEMILQFPLYLSMGVHAPDKTLSYLAANKTKRKPTAHGTNQRIISTVRGFLSDSARLQSEIHSASEHGLVNLSVAPEIMFEESLFREAMPSGQRKALMKKSVIAGVCRNGPKLCSNTILKARKGVYTPAPEGSSVKKALPHKDVLAVIDETKTFRDRLFLSLIMGTGLREIEAANVLLEDVDVKNRTVKCVNPKTRQLAYSNEYESISGETSFDMAYKGRTTDETFFIEPFRTIFFNTLRDYLVMERKPLHLGHKFLFVVLRKGEYLGRPLAISSDKTRQYPFKEALKRVYKERREPLPKGLALHSLRHFYGVHCLNYLTINYEPDGTPVRGLDINVVQRLMGHTDITATEVYAVPVIELVREKVDKALQLVQSGVMNANQKLLLNNHFGAEIN